jgi:hypothetical protein
MNRFHLFVCFLVAVSLALGASAATAAAPFTRIAALPADDVFALRVVGDTIAAGMDTVAFVSTDGGTTWRRSSKVAPGVKLVSAVLIRNGRLYAGTAGQGVHVSDDLGATWQPFNQGLVGGILNSQLDVSDLERRVNDLLVSTFGAGVYVRNLAAADTWHHFGDVFEPNQASNVNDLAVGGTRLLASAGGNGTTFHREPGDAEWTVDFLVNGQILPGQMAQSSLWTGLRWIVGTNIGVFFSPNGEQPWTPSSTRLRNLAWSTFVQHDSTVFAAFDSANIVLFAESRDQGMNWTIQERANGIFTYRLAVHGDDLYAARSDGLWIRPLASTTSVDPLPSRNLLHFALNGQPVRDAARFRFELPIAASASIELFDLTGRRAADRIAGVWSAGPHELTVDVRSLRAGVYAARLTAGSTHETVRLVRLP